MGVRTKAASKRAVGYVADDRNRFLQDGFQIARQVFLRILKQGRLEADDGRLDWTGPAAIILTGFNGQETGLLQQFSLLG